MLFDKPRYVLKKQDPLTGGWRKVGEYDRPVTWEEVQETVGDGIYRLDMVSSKKGIIKKVVWGPVTKGDLLEDEGEKAIRFLERLQKRYERIAPFLGMPRIQLNIDSVEDYIALKEYENASGASPVETLRQVFEFFKLFAGVGVVSDTVRRASGVEEVAGRVMELPEVKRIMEKLASNPEKAQRVMDRIMRELEEAVRE